MNITCTNCLRSQPVDSFAPRYEDFWGLGAPTTLHSYRPTCDECYTSPDMAVEWRTAAYEWFDPAI